MNSQNVSKSIEAGYFRDCLLLAVAVLFCFFLLAIRNSMAFAPNIFADELVYMQLAKVSGDISKVAVSLVTPAPNHLYFDVYQYPASQGYASTSMIRLYNSLFCALSVIPITQIMRRFLPVGASLVVGLAGALASAGVYSGLGIPEAMFIFIFLLCCALVASLLATSWRSTWRFGLLCLALSALILTKPHGIAIILATGCMPLLMLPGSVDWRARLRVVSTAVLAVLIPILLRQIYIHWSGGAGIEGVGLGAYGFLKGLPEMLSNSSFRTLVFSSLAVNIGSAAPLVFPALGIIAMAVLVGDRKPLLLPMAGFAVGGLVLTIIMTAAFTAFAAHVNGEYSLRVHERYYEYAVVFLIGMSVASANVLTGATFSRRAIIVGWAMAVVSFAASATFLARYPADRINFVDQALLTGAYSFPVLHRWILLLPAVLFVIVLVRRTAAVGAQLLVIVLCASFALQSMSMQARESRQMTGPDKIGLALNLEKTDGSMTRQLILVRPGQASAHRIAYYAGEGALYGIIPDSDRSHISNLLADPDTRTVVAEAQFNLGSGWVPVRTLPAGFVEYDRRSDVEGELTDRMTDATISVANGGLLAGFHDREPWGAWMAAKIASISLPKPLVGKYRVDVVARALTPQAGQGAILEACGKSYPLPMLATTAQQSVLVDCAAPDRRIVLKVLQLTSPSSLGLGSDIRMLGLGVSAVTVERLSD